MPVVRILRDVVHDALVSREIARVRPHRATIQQVDVPTQLVVLAVVGVVARDHGELHWVARCWAATHGSQLLHHGLPDLDAEELLGPVRAGEVGKPREGEAAVGVEELEPGR